MCTVSKVNDRKYSAHRRSLSLAATETTDTLDGSSKTCRSDLWSLTEAKGTSPSSRYRCFSTAIRMGNASLHGMPHPRCAFLNFPEFTASNSCRCSLHGLSSSPTSHCVIAYVQPFVDASEKMHARLRLSRYDVYIVSCSAALMSSQACWFTSVQPACCIEIRCAACIFLRL